MKTASQYVGFLLFCCLISVAIPSRAQSSENYIGETTKQDVLDSNRIYEIYYQRHQPQEETIKYLKGVEDSLTIFVFWGSWCPESKKQIPRLIKTFDEASNPRLSVRYIGTDAQKKFPKEFLNKFDIKYIPSVVVLKNDTEVRRIEEETHQPIEDRLVQILKQPLSN